MITKKDILAEIVDGRITIDEAYAFYDAVMDSDHGGKVPELLGMSVAEYTASCHGVGVEELAKWRSRGWPSKCPICGQPIDVEKFGWMAREANGSHSLVHIKCL